MWSGDLDFIFKNATGLGGKTGYLLPSAVHFWLQAVSIIAQLFYNIMN